MPLHLQDKWVWDFWFAQDGSDTHIFYLQADRALKIADSRHWHVSIGHAVSHDLRNWRILQDALRPSSNRNGNEPFDSETTWTGSVIHNQMKWYMFYTGGKKSENALIQRIGLATSDNLLKWDKHPQNPLIEADPIWYELLDLESWHDQAWRDPFVFQHPETGLFHAFITARVKDGLKDERGVIGHARSRDLIKWEVLPPVTEPGDFGHMEVPQVVKINNLYYLLFSVPHIHYSDSRKQRLDPFQYATGTHYLVADDILGPYRSLSNDVLYGDYIGTHYSGKLIQDGRGEWQFMAFLNIDGDGEFVGTISDPMPVEVQDDGHLKVKIP
jgi:beta-fructofuranosidase